MRPTLFSARIPKFEWKAGEVFEAELWLLNDKPEAVKGKVHAHLQVGDECVDLLDWSAEAEANGNMQGPTVRWILPNVETDRLTLTLESEDGMSSTYCIHYVPKKKSAPKPKILNQ